MVSPPFCTLTWWVGLIVTVALPVASLPQQATQKSAAARMRDGPAALAAAHGEKPRYGGKFIQRQNSV